MNTVKGTSKLELIINKSIFISHIAHVQSVEAAKEYINQIKTKYQDATHNVTAYITGLGGEYGHYSDDGEPSGTAGLPVFEVIRKNNLTNIVCVITRYYGGIKLGAGGLVRAYSKSTSENLKTMEIVPIVITKPLNLTIDYNYVREVENYLNKFEFVERNFTTNVNFIVKVSLDQYQLVMNELTSLTQGTIIFTNNE